ncbi:MAG: hypothetical protein SFX19_06265 [Alphaproteobacteria bacterium]|nr:hypothetical protein [Alphaproteobacteria bacterium]
METSAPAKGEQLPVNEEEKKDRTLGLRLFDVLLYPIFTNLAVFGISVGATYLTSRGGDRDAAGKLIYGKLGKWFQDRGEWMVGKFQGLGMSRGQADMSKMVFFSFADGSAMAPFVKMLEDRREEIGRWLDERMGTLPEDQGVYKAEPKHSWLSVIGGRFITAGIVVPTAVMLDKTGLNDRWFIEPGKKMGDWLTKQPGTAKWFKPFGLPLDVKELSKVSLFEFFYTSVCTAGLYLTSRRIAHFQHKSRQREEAEDAAALVASAAPPEDAAPQKQYAHEGLRRAQAADIAPASFAEKYNAEAVNVPAALGA